MSEGIEMRGRRAAWGGSWVGFWFLVVEEEETLEVWRGEWRPWPWFVGFCGEEVEEPLARGAWELGCADDDGMDFVVCDWARVRGPASRQTMGGAKFVSEKRTV